MARLTINLPGKKARRLGKHLMEEHPITRKKIKVNGKVLKRRKSK